MDAHSKATYLTAMPMRAAPAPAAPAQAAAPATTSDPAPAQAQAQAPAAEAEAMELKRDLYVVVLDESGSMERSLHSSREALTAFHTQQRATSLPTSPFKIFTFSNKVSLRFSKTIGDALEFTYRPTGGTALHDAIGFAINDTKALVATMAAEAGEVPDDVYIIVITDGFENASKQFNEESVRSLIEEQTAAHDWKFIYLAANQDSVVHGPKLGFDRGACLDFAQNHQQTRTAVSSVSAAIHRQKDEKRMWSKSMMSEDFRMPVRLGMNEEYDEEESESMDCAAPRQAPRAHPQAKSKKPSPRVTFTEQERFHSK